MQPGPWVLVFETIECRKAMSSTWAAMWGSIDEIRLPDCPADMNGQGDFISGPFLP